MRTAVADVPGEDFDRPSGCTGRLVRDLVCHLVIDAQDVLITLVTPAGTEPTADAVTYWDVLPEPPTGDDPLDALIPRLAAAYGEPRRRTRRPPVRVSTKDKVLTVADYLSAYVLEWTLHHLDLIAHLPSAPEPPAQCPAAARTSLDKIAATPLPTSLSDEDALLIGTGRRTPTDAEKTALGDLAANLPLILG